MCKLLEDKLISAKLELSVIFLEKCQRAEMMVVRGLHPVNVKSQTKIVITWGKIVLKNISHFEL